MNKPIRLVELQKYKLSFGCWDSEGNSFDLHIAREIIYLYSSSQNFSYPLNLELKVEFRREQGVYVEFMISGTTYSANPKDLCKFKDLLSASVSFLGIQNNYQISKKLGQGGQSDGVYEVLDIYSNEVRAMKKYDKSKQPVKSIYKEIKITQKFYSRNIVKIFEVYESDNSIYIIYEKLQPFQHEKYVDEQKYKFIYDLINTIQLIHSVGYMHRDIKMSNIMVSDSEIKLLDFGLATKVKKQHRQCGTPGYMAPEVFKTKEYNEKCDIYSLGLVVFEMLSGQQLYVGSNRNEIKQKNRLGLVRNNYLNIVPEQFQELIKGMLNVDPQIRLSATIAKNFSLFQKDIDNSVLTDVTQMVLSNVQKIF